MQDFFCPRCGRRMLEGVCPHCEGRASRPGTVKSKGPAKNGQPGSTRPKNAAGPALTEEKIIPFENLNPEAAKETKGGRKEEIVITLVERDEQREKEEAIARNTPWKAKGLSPAKRVSLFVSHYVSKFTAFVDRLLNPEDE